MSYSGAVRVVLPAATTLRTFRVKPFDSRVKNSLIVLCMGIRTHHSRHVTQRFLRVISQSRVYYARTRSSVGPSTRLMTTLKIKKNDFFSFFGRQKILTPIIYVCIYVIDRRGGGRSSNF